MDYFGVEEAEVTDEKGKKKIKAVNWRAGDYDEERAKKMTKQLLDEASADDCIAFIAAHISRGNTKLPDQYLIWNMTSAHRCPSIKVTREKGRGRAGWGAPQPRSANGRQMCQAFLTNPDGTPGRLVCYAWGDEDVYPGCYAKRVRQTAIWHWLRDHGGTGIDFFVEAVELICSTPGKKTLGGKTVVFNPVALRISEAGDFSNQYDVNMIMDISKRLDGIKVPKNISTSLWKTVEKINKSGEAYKAKEFVKWLNAKWHAGKFVTYTYTARNDLDFGRAGPSGDAPLVIMGSDWGINERGESIAPGIAGSFMMVESKKAPLTPVKDLPGPHPFDIRTDKDVSFMSDKSEKTRNNVQWDVCPMKCRVCQRCVLGLSSKVRNH